jgi:hypothetical protein
MAPVWPHLEHKLADKFIRDGDARDGAMRFLGR